MSISSQTTRYSYSGNGSTTVFAYPSRFLSSSDLKVIYRNTTTLVETLKTITTHYSVTGAGESNGGSITVVTAPTTSEEIIIYLDPARTQSVDLVENEKTPADTLENAYDKLTLLVQRLYDMVSRSVRLSEGFTGTFDLSIPKDLDTADSAIVTNSDGDGFTLIAIADLTGADGADGANGADGADGADGSVWRSGAGAPSNGLGANGDYYLNTSNGDVYEKAGGTYSVVDNLTGPTGATGATGAAGADGADGADGANGDAFTVSGSRGTPNAIANGGSINFTAGVGRSKIYVKGSGGAAVLASPQVQAGTIDGQEVLLCGRDDTDTVEINDGNGLALNGKAILGANQQILLNWDTSVWVEVSRNF